MILLPSTVYAGYCTDEWEQNEIVIDGSHTLGTIACNSDPNCLTENEFTHNVLHSQNDVIWAACCYVLGWANC